MDNLTNAELLAQISNYRLSTSDASELLRLNRKLTYYRNIGDMLKSVYKRNTVHVIDSDDYAREISQKMINSVLRLDRSENISDEDFEHYIDLLSRLSDEYYDGVLGGGYDENL